MVTDTEQRKTQIVDNISFEGNHKALVVIADLFLLSRFSFLTAADFGPISEYPLKVFIVKTLQLNKNNSLEINFLFFFLALLDSMWNLSSPTRDRTGTPCSGSTES